MRSMVEGVRHARRYRGEDAIQVLEDVAGRNPQNAMPILAKEGIAVFVVSLRAGIVMEASIDLDRETSRTTIKVGDVRPDGMSLAKFHAELLTTKLCP